MTGTVGHDTSAPRRRAVTVSVMLATIMQAVDTTIANVALPQMQGTMGATQDQIAWVLTSYIVAAAVAMPLTGHVAARVGRKRLFVVSVVGFTIASMLCGAAQTLGQIVAFRLLQGVFGACLVPLSQAVLLDTYPRERHGAAMAIWGVGVMVGPILGPSLGGWLTEYYDWRWTFYINLPVGVLAWLGITAFVPETPTDRKRRFDLFGFGLLGLAIGTLQLMLDRGESLNWFANPEIVVEALVAAVALYMFVAHMFTHDHPFLEPTLFRDRNFVVGSCCMFAVGAILFATMVLLPSMLHNLMGYPVVDVGLLLVPRGVGTMAAMLVVGRLAGRVDLRWQIGLGLLLTSLAMWEMMHFSLDTDAATVAWTGITQGLGLGFVFVPLSTISFSTLPPGLRNEGTALFSLMRNIGSSIGISIVVALLAHNTQTNHAALSEFINPYAVPLREAAQAGAVELASARGLALLNAEVTKQAAMLGYLQNFRLMMWVALGVLPMVLLLRPARHGRAAEAASAAEA
jgi:DHA2 family multidrug resistance protein